jgi:RND family efflux transporter MFP subunit
MGFFILRIRIFTMMRILNNFNLMKAVNNGRRSRRYFVFSRVIAAAGLMASVLGCSQSSKGYPQEPPTKTEKAPPSVTVIKPKRMTLQRTTHGPAYIQAYEQTPMFAKIAGYVRKWHVDIGDHVDQGTTLAELWIPEMEVELKQKDALVQEADAELKLARATVVVAEAEYRRSKSQFERFTQIGQSGTITKEQVEEAKLGFEASVARRDMAQAEVDVKEARLEVAKQNRENVKTLLAYRRLRAPFDGVVTRRYINTDDFVQPPTAGKGEPLYVVERRDIMRVFVPVPETDAPWVAKGALARVRVQALIEQEFTGEVARTSYSLDRAVRTLLAEIDLPNPDDRLRPNMYAYATITLEQPNALTLPVSAVVTQGDITKGYESFCFVVEGGKLRRTLIQVGTRTADRIQVLKKQQTTSGKVHWGDFTGDEVIVQENAASLTDGQTVAISPGEK